MTHRHRSPKMPNCFVPKKYSQSLWLYMKICIDWNYSFNGLCMCLVLPPNIHKAIHIQIFLCNAACFLIPEIVFSLVLLSPPLTMPPGLLYQFLFSVSPPITFSAFRTLHSCRASQEFLGSTLTSIALGIRSQGSWLYCIAKQDYWLCHSVRQKQKVHHK